MERDKLIQVYLNVIRDLVNFLPYALTGDPSIGMMKSKLKNVAEIMIEAAEDEK